jgi:hypothetical protein
MLPRGGLVLVALVALVVGFSHAATPASTVVRWSYELCRADANGCAPRFSLVGGSNDEARFTEMVAMWHTRHDDGGVLTSSILVDCAIAYSNVETIGDECLPLAQLWLAALRSAHVCGDNYQWVLGQGCVCISGHHCEVDCTETALSDLWSFTVAAGIIGVGAVAAFARQTWQDQRLAAADEEKFQRAAVAYYTLQSQLWLDTQASVAPVVVHQQSTTGTPVFHL